MRRDGCLIHEFIHMLSDPAEAKSPPENVAPADQSADEMCWKVKEGDLFRVSVAKKQKKHYK